MNGLPKKCLVDTNVPKTANLVLTPNKIPKELTGCVLACVEAVEHIVKNGGLVIDAGDEIFDEYRQQLSMKGQPGVGDRFMKWVHDNRWTFPDVDRVKILVVHLGKLENPVNLRIFGPKQQCVAI